MDAVQEKSKTPSPYSTLSIAAAFGHRSEASAQIKFLSDRLAKLGNAIEELDAAMMTTSTDMSASEQQTLVTACRNLTALLSGSASIIISPGQVIEVHSFGLKFGSCTVRTVTDFVCDWMIETLPTYRPEDYQGTYIGIVHETGAFLKPLTIEGGK